MSVGNIILGYACVNLELREEDVYTGRTAIRDTILKRGPKAGIAHLKAISLLNIADLERIVEWNETHGIKFFRVTSALFSHMGDDYFGKRAVWRDDSFFSGDISFAAAALKRVGVLAKKYGHRLDFHAQAYLQIATTSEIVLERTVFDLRVHERIAHHLGLTNPCLIVHGGGVYGDKPASIERWIKRYKALPIALRRMIMLENDEFLHNVNDVLYMCEATGAPMVFDMFHNLISDDHVPVTNELFDRIFATWKKTKLDPKLHMSDQSKGVRKGTHSQFVKELPKYFMDYCRLPRNRTRAFYCMLESKQKEKSLFKLLKHHNG